MQHSVEMSSTYIRTPSVDNIIQHSEPESVSNESRISSVLQRHGGSSSSRSSHQCDALRGNSKKKSGSDLWAVGVERIFSESSEILEIKPSRESILKDSRAKDARYRDVEEAKESEEGRSSLRSASSKNSRRSVKHSSMSSSSSLSSSRDDVTGSESRDVMAPESRDGLDACNRLNLDTWYDEARQLMKFTLMNCSELPCIGYYALAVNVKTSEESVQVVRCLQDRAAIVVCSCPCCRPLTSLAIYLLKDKLQSAKVTIGLEVKVKNNTKLLKQKTFDAAVLFALPTLTQFKFLTRPSDDDLNYSASETTRSETTHTSSVYSMTKTDKDEKIIEQHGDRQDIIMPFVTHAVSNSTRASLWTASSGDVRTPKSTIPWYKRLRPSGISFEIRKRLNPLSSQQRNKVNPRALSSPHGSSTCSSAQDTRSRRFISPHHDSKVQVNRQATARTSDAGPSNEKCPSVAEKPSPNEEMSNRSCRAASNVI